MPDDGARVAALNAELARLAKLPANSAYASHRTAVARRALELLQRQRSAAEADELERLLGGLSLSFLSTYKMDADYATLNLRRGASAAEVRAAYHALSRRHHPDKGGDAALFRRVAQAYGAISRGEGGAGGAPPPRVVREDAPTAWGDASRGVREERGGGRGGVLALERDPQLEAAFRFAQQTRKNLDVLEAYPEHRGFTFSASGTECDAACLLHITPATPDGVLCALHKRVHKCAPGVCCSEERACPMTVMCLANQWRQQAPGVMPADALARHRCSPAACSWTELAQLRYPRRGPPQRRVFVCAASGRPHICTAAQCRAGREARVLDERGGLARQWRCQISDLPLGPLMPWQDGTTLALGTGEMQRLEAAAPPRHGGGRGGGSAGRGGGAGGGRGAAAPAATLPAAAARTLQSRGAAMQQQAAKRQRLDQPGRR